MVSFRRRTMHLHTRHSWLKTRLPLTACSQFVGKGEWPQNSPDVNPLDYHVWRVMLEHYKLLEHLKTFCPKPKNTDGLKKVLQLISEMEMGQWVMGHSQ